MDSKKLIGLVVLVAAVVGGSTAAVFKGKTETIVKETVKIVREELGGTVNTLRSIFSDGVVPGDSLVLTKKITLVEGQSAVSYKNVSGNAQYAQLLLNTIATTSGAAIHASTTMHIDAYVSSSSVVSATDYVSENFHLQATGTVDQFVINNFELATSSLTAALSSTGLSRNGTTTGSILKSDTSTSTWSSWFIIPADSFVRIVLRAPVAFCAVQTNVQGEKHNRWCESATSTARGFNLEGRLLISE